MSSTNLPDITPQSSPLVNLHADPFKIVLNDFALNFRDINNLSCTCKSIRAFINPSFWQWLADQKGYIISDYPSLKLRRRK